MSLGQGFVYVQFHPLVYLLKLHIEMNMADLITKVVRAENGSYPSGSGDKYSNAKTDPRGVKMATIITTTNKRNSQPIEEDIYGKPIGGIQRTIETEVVHHNKADDDAASRSSSTAELKRQYHVV
jgi:hypothetical protein